MATKETLRTAPLRLPNRDSAVLSLRPAAHARTTRARWEETCATVGVRGDLDRDALWAIDYTIGRATTEAGRIVLDLREVAHRDYAGVPELVARRKELLARGGDLLLVVRNPYVANILRAAGGADLVLFRSLDEATGQAATAQVPARAARKA